MKITVIGNRNPHFTNTVEYRRKAVAGEGHDVVFVDDRKFALPGRVRKISSALARWDLTRLNRSLPKKILLEKPELCLFIGGHRILPGTLQRIKDGGAKVILWTTDVPHDFENLKRTAELYDFIFCSGSEMIDRLAGEGIERTHFLPFACDPDFHHPVSVRNESPAWASDVVFVGAFYPNRAEVIGQLSEFDIHVWGPNWYQWRQKQDNDVFVHDGFVHEKDWVQIYAAAKIVLVIHYRDPKTPSHQVSPKLFEAMACRKCVFVDRQRDAESLFRDGEHVVFFENTSDLKEKLSLYLENDEERERIAQKGYELVREEHTYRDRVREMFEVLRKERILT